MEASCLLPLTTSPFQSGVYFKRNKFAPVGANSFLSELIPYGKGGKKENERVTESEPKLGLFRGSAK